MTLRAIPSRLTINALVTATVVVLAARLAGVPATTATWLAAVFLLLIGGGAVLDYALSMAAWRRAAPRMARSLPAAFAIGVQRPVVLRIDSEGADRWSCLLYDHADPTLQTGALPIALTIVGGVAVEAAYTVLPTLRGEVAFAPADVRVRTRWGLCDMLERLGTTEARRVYPDFAQVARYAWLAGDRRLQEIGVKTYFQRGQGTDFKQLSEYRVGDPVRHIDWRATLRIGKPIVRQFQDERDQHVLLLIDCGRRMRADDRHRGIGTTHFDQVLNATMLLSYVALSEGDAVGVMTFGTPQGEMRSVPPRKGVHTLNSLMSHLYDVQPTPTHSDYLGAARELMRTHHKRALVVIVTNFRDEDSAELAHALQLLRSRHLVLLASLRERVVRELIEQPLVTGDAVIDVAGAHMFEQARRDAFNRLASRDTLMVDAEPERLGVELVNRYRAAKRAGTI
jgi:uncharacterized protein (DUF58 family)